jgi:hypothetical protein
MDDREKQAGSVNGTFLWIYGRICFAARWPDAIATLGAYQARRAVETVIAVCEMA